MKRHQITLIFLFSVFYLSCFSQNINRCDSLRHNLKFAKHDTVKARIYIELGDYFQYSNADTAIMFYKRSMNLISKNKIEKLKPEYTIVLIHALQKLGWATCIYKAQYDISIAFSNQALHLATELVKLKNIEIQLKAEKEISTCYNNIGRVHLEQGAYDKAHEYYKKSLKIAQKLKNNKAMHLCYFNIGNAYYYQGLFDKAIEYYQIALLIDEKIKYKEGISSCYNNIGNVHLSQKAYDKAIEYYLKSLEIDASLGDKNGMSYCNGNIGVVYENKGNYVKAIEFFLKQLKINEEIGDKKGISNCYTNLGNAYQNTGRFSEAIICLEKSLKITEGLNDKYGKALILTNIAELKLSIANAINGKSKQKTRYLNEAVNYGMKAYNLSQEIKTLPMENEAAWVLFKAHKNLGNTNKAIEFVENYIDTKDSMFRDDKTNAITEMETKYQTEKKQLAIGKLEKEKELQSSEMKKQKIMNLFIICGLLFVIGFTIVLFRMFMIKKKTNALILYKNEELEQANEEIRVKCDNETKQKKHIERIHEELTDSIIYAQRIQKAVLPMDDYLGEFLNEYFILSKPKDIVSGDFFWITKVNSWVLLCVVDCTGHGVPGAFMSMLGIALLNEIVRQEKITTASQVLDQLRKRVIESLKQKGIDSEQKDGMDMAFCAINTDTLEMQFAGANNPCWVITKFENLKINQFENGTASSNLQIDTFSNQLIEPTNELINPVSKLVELKGDKMPIGIHDRMNPFTNQIYQLQKSDTIYLMSDGFEDQFGGPNHKKFLSKNLKKLLITNYDAMSLSNCHWPMADQKQILETTITDWIGNGEQIDDITIMGIRI